MAFITNYIQNTAMGMLSTGITAAGGIAGNAVGGVGTMIENAGRSAGDSVEGVIRKGGDFINGYGDKMVSSTATQDGPVKKNAVKPPSSTAVKKASTAPKQTNGYTKPALPSASSKVKGLPAPPASAAKPVGAKGLPDPYKDAYTPVKKAGANLKSPASVAGSTGANAGKVKISAESKPKVNLPSTPKAPSVVGPKSGPGIPKPPTVGGVNAPKVPGPSTPKVPSAPDVKKVGGAVGGAVGSTAGKVKISAESKPKPGVKK